MKYLDSYHFTDFRKYCKKQCVNIVINHHNEHPQRLDYFRGRYAGYLYGAKIGKRFSGQKRITNIDMYKHFKAQINKADQGASDSLYDICNYWIAIG